MGANVNLNPPHFSVGVGGGRNMCPKTVYSYTPLRNRQPDLEKVLDGRGGGTMFKLGGRGQIPCRGVAMKFCQWGTDSAASNPPTPKL